MSDMNQRNKFEEEQVELYRKQKAEAFRLNIGEDVPASDNTQVFERAHKGKEEASAQQDTSNEITSFSNESTRAQIERDSKKALRAEKREAKKVRQIKSGRNKKVYRIAWLLLVIILSAVMAEFMVSGFNDLFAVQRTEEETVTIIVSVGDDSDDIAKKLEGKGAVDSAMFFSMFLGLTGKGDEIEPGVYEVATNKDYLGVVNYLRNVDNRQTTITLQFTEGMNVIEIAEQLYDSGVTSDKEQFLQLCNSSEFDEDYSFIADIEDNPERLYKLEGYLFPDTYEFYVDEDPALTISRFLDNFDRRVCDTKLELAGFSEKITIEDLAARSDMSIDEIVNIASIVQGEAANVEDMYNVASVIENRLERGASMDIYTLGMDSTQFYPYSSFEEIPEDIRDTFESAYETYDSEGLPPGAICSPGLDAITAAVNPNSTNYFYFCHGAGADGEATSYYAETLLQHQANLAAAGLN
ncbi:MAG: endolytic transglycosylase MltG [Ruminococcus sp.]|nr:endolytic transglycosylase MltG [Ruminococcus sp.]